MGSMIHDLDNICIPASGVLVVLDVFRFLSLHSFPHPPASNTRPSKCPNLWCHFLSIVDCERHISFIFFTDDLEILFTPGARDLQKVAWSPVSQGSILEKETTKPASLPLLRVSVSSSRWRISHNIQLDVASAACNDEGADHL